MADTALHPTDHGERAHPTGLVDAFSSLEFALEHLLGETPVGRASPRREGDLELSHPRSPLVDDASRACRVRGTRTRGHHEADDPPF